MSSPFGAATQTGQRKRVIEETPYPNAPVQIVRVTNRRNHIKFKESFSDDDDWLKGLEVEVINKSEKTVTHVGINLFFERPPDQAHEFPILWPLNYGFDPFLLEPDEPIPPSKVRAIRPGEKVTIPLSDLAYEDLKAFLTDARFDGIEKMKMFVTTISFDDGTAWRGSFYIRDPGSPGGWRPKERPPGSTKKGAAFLLSSYHHAPNVNAGAWLKPASLQQGGECGQAATINYACVEGTECKYPRVVNFDQWSSLPDKVIVTGGPCYFGQSTFNCASAPVAPRVVPCPNPTPTPTPTPTPLPCAQQDNICMMNTDCCSRVCNGGLCAQSNCTNSWAMQKCFAGGEDWNPSTCRCDAVTPVLIDVEGDGFALTDAAGGVGFDFNGDHQLDQRGWTAIGSDDAWLCLDRNGNGTIDHGGELFGNSSFQLTAGERNGFLALAEFDKPTTDGNGDGRITSEDRVFSWLRLWQDANHNGVSEPGELHPLLTLGVVEIELNYKESKQRDAFGNWFRYRAKVRDGSGSQVGRWAWDVILARSP